MPPPHAVLVRWFLSIILALCLLGTRDLLGAQEIGGGSASVATGYDLSGLRATHSDLLASGAWSSNAAGETSQARGRPVVNDLLGRVTSLDGWNHTYSCDGLLLSSEPSAPAEGSRRSTHAYDALGRRVRTVVQAYVGGQWVAFSATERDFIGRLPLGIETSFADGSLKSWRFLRGPDVSGTLEGAGGARGVLAVLKDASSWKAVAADTLGNVLALAGVNGDFQRRTFDPWGNPLTRDASGSLRASTLQERRADYDALPLAWASQEVDPDTGLTHYHFREYSPSLGGWLTTDPIGLAGGYLNLRSYLGNRPADALDVWGEEAVITYINGSTIRANDSGQFVKAINESRHGTISKITFYGHADPNHQTFDSRNSGSMEFIRKRRVQTDKEPPCKEGKMDAVLVGPSIGNLLVQNYMTDAIVHNKDGAAIGYDLGKLLNGKFAESAKVNVEGCRAGDCKGAKDGVSIARAISQSIPDTVVEASRNYVYRYTDHAFVNPFTYYPDEGWDVRFPVKMYFEDRTMHTSTYKYLNGEKK